MSHHQCHCCACADHQPSPSNELPGVSRRKFLFGVGALTVGGLALSSYDLGGAVGDIPPARTPRFDKTLKVLPVLTYEIPKRREATSWRNWGGIQTEADVKAEQQHIEKELAALKAKAGFQVEFLPVALVENKDRAAAALKSDADVLILYAAGGGGDVLETMTQSGKGVLMFLRHDPGPVYLWYEIAHPRFLRKTVDEYGQSGLDVHDIVVDSQEEILWRLRSFYGLKNTLNKRIVAIGGASGWGQGGSKAPATTKSLWKMDLVDYPYAELGPRIKAARNDAALVKRCQNAATQYLRQSGTTLHTTRQFVSNAFVLCEVIKDVMDEAKTDAMTINSCMGTIMPMAETTACLPLSLLNDEGYLAFCESDFVVIPSGVLLHYISGKPVFLNDPTYPHGNVVTLAHCTAPRKMDGVHNEKAKILTHFESDYGAAPKVEMKLGQTVTNLVPDFASHKWVGFAGTIVGNPFLDICRSQIDVRIDGDGDRLMEEMKGFHWMTSYGNYLRETGYALKKTGVGWLDVSKKA
jgi:hypothetical protein